MFKQISLLGLIAVALTVVTCFLFQRITPSAPCDPKEVSEVAGFWVLIVGVIGLLCRWIWSWRAKKTTPVGH